MPATWSRFASRHPSDGLPKRCRVRNLARIWLFSHGRPWSIRRAFAQSWFQILVAPAGCRWRAAIFMVCCVPNCRSCTSRMAMSTRGLTPTAQPNSCRPIRFRTGATTPGQHCTRTNAGLPCVKFPSCWRRFSRVRNCCPTWPQRCPHWPAWQRVERAQSSEASGEMIVQGRTLQPFQPRGVRPISPPDQRPRLWPRRHPARSHPSLPVVISGPRPPDRRKPAVPMARAPLPSHSASETPAACACSSAW